MAAPRDQEAPRTYGSYFGQKRREKEVGIWKPREEIPDGEIRSAQWGQRQEPTSNAAYVPTRRACPPGLGPPPEMTGAPGQLQESSQVGHPAHRSRRGRGRGLPAHRATGTTIPRARLGPSLTQPQPGIPKTRAPVTNCARGSRWVLVASSTFRSQKLAAGTVPAIISHTLVLCSIAYCVPDSL